jgi:hypothetical protein
VNLHSPSPLPPLLSLFGMFPPKASRTTLSFLLIDCGPSPRRHGAAVPTSTLHNQIAQGSVGKLEHVDTQPRCGCGLVASHVLGRGVGIRLLESDVDVRTPCLITGTHKQSQGGIKKNLSVRQSTVKRKLSQAPDDESPPLGDRRLTLRCSIVGKSSGLLCSSGYV